MGAGHDVRCDCPGYVCSVWRTRIYASAPLLPIVCPVLILQGDLQVPPLGVYVRLNNMWIVGQVLCGCVFEPRAECAFYSIKGYRLQVRSGRCTSLCMCGMVSVCMRELGEPVPMRVRVCVRSDDCW